MTLPRKSSSPRVWPQRDRQQTTAVVREGDLAEKKTWMGRSLTKFSSWQPLLNKYGTVWWRPKGTHSLIFMYSSIFFSLFVIPELRSMYQIECSCISCPQIPLLSLFIPLSLPHYCGIFPSAHLSISLFPVGFNGFLCAVSSQSDPSSDKYSFQRPFTGNEPISGFSSHSMLAGKLTCKKKRKNESMCLSICLAGCNFSTI